MLDGGDEAGEAAPVGGVSELVAALFTCKVLGCGDLCLAAKLALRRSSNADLSPSATLFVCALRFAAPP